MCHVDNWVRWPVALILLTLWAPLGLGICIYVYNNCQKNVPPLLTLLSCALTNGVGVHRSSKISAFDDMDNFCRWSVNFVVWYRCNCSLQQILGNISWWLPFAPCTIISLPLVFTPVLAPVLTPVLIIFLPLIFTQVLALVFTLVLPLVFTLVLIIFLPPIFTLLLPLVFTPVLPLVFTPVLALVFIPV